MAKIEKSKLTSEMIAAAMQCKTADELMALAKSGGYEITREEAEAYMAELVDYDLDEEKLQASPVASELGTLSLKQPRHDGEFHLME